MIPGDLTNYSALLQRKQGIRCIHTRRLKGERVWPESQESSKRSIEGFRVNREVESFDLPQKGNEQVMFVNDVESVKTPEGVVSSKVRLQSVYPLFKRLGDSLCLSRRLGFVRLWASADREIDIASG